MCLCPSPVPSIRLGLLGPALDGHPQWWLGRLVGSTGSLISWHLSLSTSSVSSLWIRHFVPNRRSSSCAFRVGNIKKKTATFRSQVATLSDLCPLLVCFSRPEAENIQLLTVDLFSACPMRTRTLLKVIVLGDSGWRRRPSFPLLSFFLFFIFLTFHLLYFLFSSVFSDFLIPT